MGGRQPPVFRDARPCAAPCPACQGSAPTRPFCRRQGQCLRRHGGGRDQPADASGLHHRAGGGPCDPDRPRHRTALRPGLSRDRPFLLLAGLAAVRSRLRGQDHRRRRPHAGAGGHPAVPRAVGGGPSCPGGDAGRTPCGGGLRALFRHGGSLAGMGVAGLFVQVGTGSPAGAGGAGRRGLSPRRRRGGTRPQSPAACGRGGGAKAGVRRQPPGGPPHRPTRGPPPGPAPAAFTI